MTRATPGRYVTVSTASEPFEAFVPVPLPPKSSLADLLLFEAKEQRGVPLEDVREVSRYVAALEHGVKRILPCSSLLTGSFATRRRSSASAAPPRRPCRCIGPSSASRSRRRRPCQPRRS